MSESTDTHQKALQINLDPSKYGVFAEIGAGQEVARWFFRAGGASGTIAKSISAYDMTVSDAIYGSTDRYVSQKRLAAMLDHEYGLLVERLAEKRDPPHGSSPLPTRWRRAATAAGRKPTDGWASGFRRIRARSRATS